VPAASLQERTLIAGECKRSRCDLGETVCGGQSWLLRLPSTGARDRRGRAVLGGGARIAGIEIVPYVVDSALGERRRRVLAEVTDPLRRGDLSALGEAALLVSVVDALRMDTAEAGALRGWSYLQTRRLLQPHRSPGAIRVALAERKSWPLRRSRQLASSRSTRPSRR
jgi:hypothetical protein